VAKTHAVPVSKNTKLTGKIPTKEENAAREARGLSPRILRNIASTARTPDTCAPDCPFMDKGEHNDQEGVPICYPNDHLGRPSIFDMAETHGLESSKEALDRIKYETPKGSKVRHLVSGDVASPNDDYIEASNNLHAVRKDLEGFGYTHHWERLGQNPARNWTLNASTETPEQVGKALKMGYQAVIESPEGASLAGTRIEGRRVVSCPNQTTHGLVGCNSCSLCSDDTPTRPVVEFMLHGQSPKKIAKVGESIVAQREAGKVDLGMPSPRKADAFKTGFSDRG
jgi:hypothetical protein